jgi:hypothetical protein
MMDGGTSEWYGSVEQSFIRRRKTYVMAKDVAVEED